MIDGNSLAKAAGDEALKNLGCMFLVTVACILGAVGIWAGSSYFEASAYNRVTGSNVSTWDAMWIELRVQSGPKD